MFVAILITGTIFAEAIREQQLPQQPRQMEFPRYRDNFHRENFQAMRERWQNFDLEVFNNRHRELNREFNSVTVDGTLKLDRGVIAIESGSNFYYVPLLTRYIGFINELKEGAFVTIEGYVFRNMLQPVKLIIDGNSYDFPAPGRAFVFGNQNFNRRFDNERPHRFENVRPERGVHPERMNTRRRGS